MEHTATYSPEDNKLRLYPACRLSKEEYERVKAAGFSWAPKQELFVAPMWTPYREDLLLEMCGEIGDEDTSLVDRAEQRAERFEEYSDARQRDADLAHKAVADITDNIPLGQPILVGHHSERRARKDAERIENGMRKAVKMWETSKYWEQRAAGAIAHAKYKELPGVRYRRIKGIEADKRREERSKADAEQALRVWTKVAEEQDREKQMQMALAAASLPCRFSMPRKEGDRPDFDQRPDPYTVLTNGYPSLYAPRTIEEVIAVALSGLFERRIAHCDRWINHCNNRIAYERAMLDEGGGIKGEQFDYQPGGRILRRGEWLPIVKVNKRDGIVQSVTVLGHFASTVSVDEIKDYRPPQEGDAEKIKAITDKGPMCNYPGDGFKHMTTAEWKSKKMSDVPQAIIHKATETHDRHRTRATWGGNWTTVSVYLTDAKRIDPPAKATEPKPTRAECFPREVAQDSHTYRTAVEREPDPNEEKFEALKDQLKEGVKVVSAPQLFPTPPDLAARMVALAELTADSKVLEPSAGTGNILLAIGNQPDKTAVEISYSLVDGLARIGLSGLRVYQGDFLEQNGNLGKFDAVVMNPPFENGVDIKHIRHALTFLKPGGRLVAICANGSRQNRELKPLVEQYGGEWEELPPGTFASQGTGVNTVLMWLTLPGSSAGEQLQLL